MELYNHDFVRRGVFFVFFWIRISRCIRRFAQYPSCSLPPNLSGSTWFSSEITKLHGPSPAKQGGLLLSFLLLTLHLKPQTCSLSRRRWIQR